MTRTTIVVAAALALAVTLPAVQAQAQSPRTFVSAAGNDSNPCTFAAPCRHFQAAVNATSLGGEVDALDPAGYGPITISQAITIEGQGWSYAAPAANSPAITINAVTGNVYIHGVSLNGVGITGLTTGIAFISGGSLTVRDSVIRNFNEGIIFTPNSSASSKLFVSNTMVSDNATDGIFIATSGSGTTSGAFGHVEIEHNGGRGLFIFTNTQTINMTFSDGVVSDNASVGISVESDGGTPVNMMVRNSAITDNMIGLEASGTASASIRATRSAITGNGTAWKASGGAVTSYADNNIEDNGSANNAPFQIGLK